LEWLGWGSCCHDVVDFLVGGFNSTHLKNMIVKLGSSSPNRGENEKYLKPPPRFFTGVGISPDQTMHYFTREIPQNYHKNICMNSFIPPKKKCGYSNLVILLLMGKIVDSQRNLFHAKLWSFFLKGNVNSSPNSHKSYIHP